MAKAKKHVETLSSVLVFRSAIIVSFLASLIMNWLELGIFAVLLFSISVLGVVSRIWGLFSLRKVEARIAAEKSTMSVGDTAVISYTLTNNKLLPVMWLELCQDVPDNDCLLPDSGFSRYEITPGDAGVEERTPYFRKSIVFLWSYQSISWNTTWSARRRGLYIIDRLFVRSGDGFGLTHSTQSLSAGSHLLIVWPKIVSITTIPFFRNVWQGVTGRSGYVEDPTVVQGLRDYLPGDIWKHIDWRVAARQDELQVRKYETMLPGTVHFILDVKSFLDISAENDELEEAISILASLILDLENLGIQCGLSIPGGTDFQPVNISPESVDTSGRDLLYALSALKADMAMGDFDEAAIYSISQTVGQVWMLTYSGERLTCHKLTDKLENVGFSLLCYDSCTPGSFADRPILNLSEIRMNG